MSEKPQKRPHRRVPMLVYVLGIPIVGALLVNSVALLLLSGAGITRVSWASSWAIIFSVLISAIVLFVTFGLGVIYCLRLVFRLLGEVFDDVFQALPKQGSGPNPLDALLLSIARSTMSPNVSQAREGAPAPTRGVVIDAEPAPSPGEEPT